MINNAYAKLQQSSIMTASPQELTLMLYNGAIKFVNQAIKAIEENNSELANNLIIKTEDIILELKLSLNKDYEISKEFETMYNYIYQRLIDANISKDIQILEEVNRFLREFRDTWKQVMKRVKR